MATARRFALDEADGLVDDAGRQVLELLVSELVTHAVVHAQTSCSVVLCRHDRRIRVEVDDESRQYPYMKELPGEAAGWGIRLLAMLAHDCCVEKRPRGKSVWFVV